MKKLSKILLLVLVAALLVGCFAGCGPKNTPTPTPAGDKFDINNYVIEKGKLYMSTNAEFPPYEMTDDAGKFIGIDVEVAGLIAQKLGLELVVLDMGFTAALEAPQNGKSDIAMAGITVNEERKANMDFTDSYATGIQVVIVKEDSPIKSIDDLANAEMIGTQAGTTGYIYCSSAPEDGGYGEDHVTAYDNGNIAVQALIAGKVDCVVIDNLPAQEYVKANPGLKILETEFAVEDYAIALGKGKPELLKAINDALKELIASGAVQKVVDSYIKA